jgi:hypothetical protein
VIHEEEVRKNEEYLRRLLKEKEEISKNMNLRLPL